MRNRPPMEYWTHYLQQRPEYFDQGIKRLIMTTLAIPTGSSDAERAFSALNNIKTKLRNRVKTNMMNSLMGIKINSVKKLEDFPAVSLAKTWVLRGNPRSDTPFRKTGMRPPGPEDNFEPIDEEDFDDTYFYLDAELF